MPLAPSLLAQVRARHPVTIPPGIDAKAIHDHGGIAAAIRAEERAARARIQALYQSYSEPVIKAGQVWRLRLIHIRRKLPLWLRVVHVGPLNVEVCKHKNQSKRHRMRRTVLLANYRRAE